ncbi:MAG: hypothetical protein IPK83_08385 [Planctomycetes bacterium]|nr:hypothetical protein [Planctomycetota bacterium]
MTPEEIEPLPVDAILETLVSEYPDLNLIQKTIPPSNLKPTTTAISPSNGTHHFRFEFSGDAEREMNRIVSIMSRFNLPCYDASEFKLYAASNPPEFRSGMRPMGSPIQLGSGNFGDETPPPAEKRTPNWEKRLAELVDPTREKQSRIESNNALLKSLLASQSINRPDSDADAPPWKRVGLNDDDLADACKNLNDYAASQSHVPPEQSDEMELWVSSTMSNSLAAMAINQAGYPGLAPPLDDNRIAAERIAAAGMAYFFGDWRLNPACISQLFKGEPVRHALPLDGQPAPRSPYVCGPQPMGIIRPTGHLARCRPLLRRGRRQQLPWRKCLPNLACDEAPRCR